MGILVNLPLTVVFWWVFETAVFILIVPFLPFHFRPTPVTPRKLPARNARSVASGRTETTTISLRETARGSSSFPGFVSRLPPTLQTSPCRDVASQSHPGTTGPVSIEEHWELLGQRGVLFRDHLVAFPIHPECHWPVLDAGG